MSISPHSSSPPPQRQRSHGVGTVSVITSAQLLQQFLRFTRFRSNFQLVANSPTIFGPSTAQMERYLAYQDVRRIEGPWSASVMPRRCRLFTPLLHFSHLNLVLRNQARKQLEARDGVVFVANGTPISELIYTITTKLIVKIGFVLGIGLNNSTRRC